jgi:hypothetical protein
MKKILYKSIASCAILFLFLACGGGNSSNSSQVGGNNLQSEKNANDISEWSGSGVVYSVGDLVTYQGKIYKVVLAHTSVSNWYPDAVWYFEFQGDVVDTTDNEEDTNNTEDSSTQTIQDWDGNGVSYEEGDLVRYNGKIYKVVLAHTSVANWYPDTIWYFELQNSDVVDETDSDDTNEDDTNETVDESSENNTDNNTTVTANEWSGNSISYKVGDFVRYNGKVYKVVLAHTSVANWYPDSVWYFELYEGAISETEDTESEDQNETTDEENDSNTSTDGSDESDANEQNTTIDDNKSNKHFAIGYLPTWSLEGFHTADYASSQIATIDELYSHVVISFAKPDMTFNGTNFVGTGVEFASHLEGVKKAVEVLQQRGVKVLLAVGGATYNNWDPLANEQGLEISATTHKKALRAFIDALNLDGIDVDYEVSGADSVNVERYYKSILALKEVVGDKLLTMAGWSTGADCTAATSHHSDCQGKVSYWGNSAGRERILFKKFRDNGYIVEELFDYVAIMTYDGGLNRFDPINLFENYQAIYNGPLAMGFEIPSEAWGGAELVVTNAEAEVCQWTSMISGDSYSSGGSKRHYSMERLVNFVNSTPNSGVMLWSLYEPKYGTSCTEAVDYESFTAAMKNYLDENVE